MRRGPRSLVVVLVPPAVLLALGLLLAGPIAQDPAYHRFADARTLFGIANFADTMSNLGFLAVGLWGLKRLLGDPGRRPAFTEPGERAAWLAFFTGIALTGLGSAWYHLAPDDARLVWDRLPMTLGFASLFVIVLGERCDPQLTARGLVLTVLLAAASVGWWVWSGDLRPYVFVQAYCVIALALLVGLFESRYTRHRDYWALIGAYAAAKLAESGDAAIFAASGLVSGHTLKHLLATGGVAWIAVMLARRDAIARGG